MLRNPLVPVTAAFAAGIWAAPRLFLSASEQVFFLSLIVVGSAALFAIRRYGKGLLLALLGFFLCGVFLVSEERAALPTQHIESLAERGLIDPAQSMQITGWARTPSVSHPRGQYFDLALTVVRQQGRDFPAEGIIRLNEYLYDDKAKPLDIPYGTRLTFPLKDLRRPRNYLTPGSYDWAGYMRRQGIYFTGVPLRTYEGREAKFFRNLEPTKGKLGNDSELQRIKAFRDKTKKFIGTFN